MNKYINEIERLIELQINKSKGVTIIRLDGMESPVIYREVCKTLFNSGIDLKAKLSKAKYEEFKKENNNEWLNAIRYLENKNFIDLDDTMTRWRNSSTELESTLSKKTLILLMGTEMVDDKGGLEDFYCITPETILNIVKKNYSRWFEEILEEFNENGEHKKAINTLLKVLFKNINVDLSKLSILIEELENLNLGGINELVEEICFRLKDYWNIPNVIDVKYIPKVSNLKKGTVSSAAIIEKSFNFINRIKFNKGVTKANIEKYKQRIDKYANDNDIDLRSNFPYDNPQFKNYEEFKNDLIDFISGKNYIMLREKFLNVDYALIDKIIMLKLDQKPKEDKEKDIKVFGEPIEIYIEMISKLIYEFKNQFRIMPSEIELKVNSIKLSNCSTEEEANRLYKLISSNIAGIVNYFNQGNEYSENIKIKYLNNVDPFSYDSNKEVVLEKSASATQLSKISYTVRAIGEDEETKKRDFMYCFKNNDSWINDYILINSLFDDEKSEISIPLYQQCRNIRQFVNCESDDEFFSRLEKIDIKNVEAEFALEINILDSEILNKYGLLINDYKAFLNKFKSEGIYSTFNNNNEGIKVFKRYADLFNYICENYMSLTSIQQEKVKLILNLFTIGDKSYEEFLKDKNEIVMIGPYHPIMLEKIYYRSVYIKKSFREILTFIESTEKLTEQKIQKKLDYIFKMCLIDSGFDIYSFSSTAELVLGKTHGNYSIYVSKRNSIGDLVSDIVLNNINDGEEIDKKSIIKKSNKSDIISQNIIDYINTFPARADGVNLLFINPDDIQHVVAGIHCAVDLLEDKFKRLNLNIRVLVSNSRKSGASYLKQWLNNYFDDNENIKIKTYVNYYDFQSNDANNKLIELPSQDLVYVYNILENSKIDFIKSNESSRKSDIKYPASYSPMPISLSEEGRKIDISQRQFITSMAHMQLTHRILRPNDINSSYKVIKKMILEDSKKSLLNLIHEKSKWVICLDETIDKDMLSNNGSTIIGFSTGKGIFGELNTTVSAREDIILDIQKKLKYRMMQKFTKWLPEVAEEAANNCTEISKNLDGSKMLKALNPNDYAIHNYLAYVLTMQSMHMHEGKSDESALNILINLDNYLHWFDINLSSDYLKENRIRPDFLILRVDKKENLKNIEEPLKIKAYVIECKMGNENQDYLDEAKEQVFEGIKILASNFSPTNTSARRRYWFNQLYRALVFSKVQLNDNEEGYNLLLDKISGIYDGNFEIEWNGRIYAYWINQNSRKIIPEDITLEYKEKFEDEGCKINNFTMYQVGQLAIQMLLLPKEFRNTEIEYSEQIEYENDNFIDNLENDSLVENKLKEKELYIEKDNSSKELEEGNRTEEDILVERGEAYGIKEEGSSEKIIEGALEDENKETQLVNLEKRESNIRFLLGEDVRNKEKIYWEYTHKNLNNRHLLINGNSGCGKTYCIQTLILEAVKNNISVVVFDYTDGFTKSKLSPVLLERLGDKFEERQVKYKKFPINPFKKGTVIANGEEFKELDQDIANRIADSFKNVYKLGDQQRSAVYTAVKAGLKECGDAMNLETLRDKLEECENKAASTVLSKIESLVDYDPFLGETDFSWKSIIEEYGMMYVIQLSGYTREIQVILTELILWDIWNYSVRNGSEKTPLPLVLDEAQNLSHGEKSPSAKILAEGRKFGISGWYATQFMAGRLNIDEIGNLQQAAQKLYFNPPENSIVEVSKYIDVSNEGSKIWAEKLSKLTKGFCVTVGSRERNNKFDKYEPRIIKITSLEERINE